MNIRVSVLFFLLFVVFSGVCFSDTLYLKDGRTIDSETIWEEGDYYKYILYGATVGISKNMVERVVFSKKDESSFQFDIWPFGITVVQAIDVAEKNNIPLHKSGVMSVNKNFHPQVKKYSDATHFYYNASLLGHFAKVELVFTPISKKLHTVKIRWPNQNKKDAKLANEISTMISKKYGKHRNKGKKLFYSATEWITEEKNQIEMRIRSAEISLLYIHNFFRQLDYEESENIKIEKINEGAKKDSNKF